ncbi:FecR family protein [Psychroserpens sp. XS_ASV72]|uniref:FecR family protein n=1 Tax=Psychroserpens sp. XS_ASV72 TaxID=3241293 RepID=UPI003517044D
MEQNYHTDETFLARWIAGELSDEELAAFKKTDAYKEFKRIDEEAQLLSGPEIDVEKALKNVQEKISTPTTTSKSKTIQLWQKIAVAAILILSLGFYLNSSKTYSNGIGDNQTIVLNDGSEVHLNSNSSISLKRFFWSNDKTVKLTGEAYFTITKGDDFKVETSQGVVRVLGTQFNIRDRITFELKCYEGTVEFSQKNMSASPQTLTKGMQINIENNTVENLTFQEDSPDWRNGLSKFEAQPLHLVLEELKQYFDIDFETENVNTERLFSGSFEHNNLDLALKSTLVPMGITYELKGNTIILTED